MSFWQRMILIGSLLVLGVIAIFAAKLLLCLMHKAWVVLILAIAGFFLVLTVIRFNTPKWVVPRE